MKVVRELQQFSAIKIKRGSLYCQLQDDGVRLFRASRGAAEECKLLLGPPTGVDPDGSPTWKLEPVK